MRKEVKLSKSQLMGLNPYMVQLQNAQAQVNEYFAALLLEKGEDPSLPWQFTQEGSLVNADSEGNS